MSREHALERRYIEANPQAVSNLLVIDVDHGDAVLRALCNRPLPNAVVENPRNGHAHALYILAEPITRTEYARRKPLAYAAAVTEGLRRMLDGDQAYSGLITKNPCHEAWSGMWFSDELYDLNTLRDGLGEHMPSLRWRETKSRRENPIGLGRNCTLFETARTWAYREVRHHWGDPHGLGVAIEERAHELNCGFSEPLPASEVRAIATSITRWITTRSRMWADGPAVYEATFSTIQSARGRKPRPHREVTDAVREANRDRRVKVDRSSLADLGVY